MAIRAAASRQFAERGYDRASMRSIAVEAGVDPALVAHFFGTKQQLFVDVIELPFDPGEVVPMLFTGERERLGRRLADFLLDMLENPQARLRMMGLVRASASEPQAARMVRELLSREVLLRVIDALDVGDAELRASLVGSQVVGLVMARYIVGVEPLRSLNPERVASAIAPTLQRHLTGPLDAD